MSAQKKRCPLCPVAADTLGAPSLGVGLGPTGAKKGIREIKVGPDRYLVEEAIPVRSTPANRLQAGELEQLLQFVSRFGPHPRFSSLEDMKEKEGR